MMLKHVTAIVAVALAATTAGLATDAPTAQALNDGQWCSVSATAPCIVSAAVNGTAVAPTDPTWDVSVVAGPPVDGGTSINWWVSRASGSGDPLDLGGAATTDLWSITIDTGSIVPRVLTMAGDAVTLDRSPQGGGDFRVTVAGHPIPVTAGAADGSTADCDQSAWPWTCRGSAVRDVAAALSGWITDYGAWADAAQRDTFYGMDYATGIEATDIPPQVGGDPGAGSGYLVIDLANPHKWHSGATYLGAFHLRIPNAFLKSVYGVDDPAAMNATGLTATLTNPDGTTSSSGDITISQEAGNDAMVVDGSGITFSAKVLKIRRGRIVPTRPTKVRAHRRSAHVAKVAFNPARPRGSRIRGYDVRCVAVRHHPVVSVHGARSPLRVRGLVRHAAYTCRVRATSKAGPGSWSSGAHLKA